MLAIVIADRKAGNSFREAGVQFLKTRRRVPDEKTMAMSMGGGGASGPQMNVTPLIDVLLVLIIIFMVIVAKSKKDVWGSRRRFHSHRRIRIQRRHRYEQL